MYQQAVKSFLGSGPTHGSIVDDGTGRSGAKRGSGATSGENLDIKRVAGDALSSDPTIVTRTEAERVIGQIEDTVASLRAELAPYLPSRAAGDGY